jgi:hypothetical protein
MFGKRRAESGDNADGKFSGSQVCKKGGFHMRSLRALRIVGIGLAFAAILASGGLPGGSQSGQEEISSFIVTLSFTDNKVACIEARFAADGKLVEHAIGTVTVARGPSGLDVYGPVTYVASWDSKALTVLDNDKCTVIKTLPLGGNLYTVAFRPDGKIAYVLDAQNKQIIVLNTSNLADPQVLTKIPLPIQSPRGMDFHPRGYEAYVADTESDTLLVFDTINHELFQTLHTGGQCSSFVKASPDGRHVYVADRCQSRVFDLDVETGTFTPIQLSGNSGAWFITFGLDNLVAFVSQTDPRRRISSGKISIIDVAQKKEIGTIDVSSGATAAASKDMAGSAELFAPAGLGVLFGGEHSILVVFPFAEGETSLMAIPFISRTDQTGALTEVVVGSLNRVPTPLNRPFFGTLFGSCYCDSIYVESKRQSDEPITGTPPKVTPNPDNKANTITITVEGDFEVNMWCYRSPMWDKKPKPCIGYVAVAVEDTLGTAGRKSTSLEPAPNQQPVKCENKDCDRPFKKDLKINYTITFVDHTGKHTGKLKLKFTTRGCKENRVTDMIIAIKDNKLDEDESDWDADGLTNKEEKDKKTNPWDPDTDKDGIPDGKDACPTQAGRRSSDPSKNGCP